MPRNEIKLLQAKEIVYAWKKSQFKCNKNNGSKKSKISHTHFSGLNVLNPDFYLKAHEYFIDNTKPSMTWFIHYWILGGH